MTLHDHLSVANFAWREGALASPCPAVGPDSASGRFAAAGSDEQVVWMTRDKLGLNKLFAAWHCDEGVVVSNFLHELVEQGVPFEAIFAAPAGAVTRIDLERMRSSREGRFVPVTRLEADAAEERASIEAVRTALVATLKQIRASVGPRVAICLSGGLDSALVAAYARTVFDEVRAFTYSYCQGEGSGSEDSAAAERLAGDLGLDLVAVLAGPADILEAVDDALRYGQDWRDFNVHCAIVNVLLGRSIAASTSGQDRPTVLTGDLMNEFLGDYTPIVYAGREHYRLPRVEFDRLRRVLVSGIQAGDREVGVFHATGVEVLQPYAGCSDSLLQVASLQCARGKQAIMEQLADGMLPSWLLSRPKVRAQIGDAQAKQGILPLLVDRGWDSEWLRARFAALHGTAVESLADLLRAGVYRHPTQARPRVRDDGYVCV